MTPITPVKARPFRGRLPAALLALVLPVPAVAQRVLELQPGVARPGGLIWVRVLNAPEPPSGKAGSQALTFFPGPDGTHEALHALSVELDTAELRVVIRQAGDRPELGGMLELLPANFARRELSVASKYIKPPPSVRKWIAEDKAAFAKAFRQPTTPRGFSRNFVWPRRAPITAPFGDLRLFNGKKQSQHHGTDIDGSTGEPVFAANEGRVVLSRECYGSGNTVLVYHGAQLFTAYFHLSRIVVNEGERLAQDQLLGEVGKTGRVTGPHLHWGVKVNGRWVDPEALLAIDFERSSTPPESPPAVHDAGSPRLP